MERVEAWHEESQRAIFMSGLSLQHAAMEDICRGDKKTSDGCLKVTILTELQTGFLVERGHINSNKSEVRRERVKLGNHAQLRTQTQQTEEAEPDWGYAFLLNKLQVIWGLAISKE